MKLFLSVLLNFSTAKFSDNWQLHLRLGGLYPKFKSTFWGLQLWDFFFFFLSNKKESQSCLVVVHSYVNMWSYPLKNFKALNWLMNKRSHGTHNFMSASCSLVMDPFSVSCQSWFLSRVKVQTNEILVNCVLAWIIYTHSHA